MSTTPSRTGQPLWFLQNLATIHARSEDTNGAYGVVEMTGAPGDMPPLHVTMWALCELVEAATRTGDTELAQRGLVRLDEQTRASDTDWGLGIHARSRALLSQDETAERFYREAIETQTDELAMPAYAGIGAQGVARILELAPPIVKAVTKSVGRISVEQVKRAMPDDG